MEWVRALPGMAGRNSFDHLFPVPSRFLLLRKLNQWTSGRSTSVKMCEALLPFDYISIIVQAL